jgi:2-haloalkanoic acid dehalogenase type II
MIKAVVFDLYGTLVAGMLDDKGEDLDEELSRILRQARHEVYYQEVEAARHMVFFIDYPRGRADTPQEFYAKVLERLEIPFEPELVDKLARKATELERVRLYEDAVSTVKALKSQGIKTAVLTTVPSWLFRHVLDDSDVKIDFICTAKEAKAVKPNPQIYHIVLHKIGVKPNEALMVGDTPEIDIIPPKKLGMKTALLCRKGKKTVKEADYIITSLRQLLKIVRENARAPHPESIVSSRKRNP